MNVVGNSRKEDLPTLFVVVPREKEEKEDEPAARAKLPGIVLSALKSAISWSAAQEDVRKTVSRMDLKPIQAPPSRTIAPSPAFTDGTAARRLTHALPRLLELAACVHALLSLRAGREGDRRDRRVCDGALNKQPVAATAHRALAFRRVLSSYRCPRRQTLHHPCPAPPTPKIQRRVLPMSSVASPTTFPGWTKCASSSCASCAGRSRERGTRSSCAGTASCCPR